jgi:hypothetical protein
MIACWWVSNTEWSCVLAQVHETITSWRKQYRRLRARSCRSSGFVSLSTWHSDTANNRSLSSSSQTISEYGIGNPEMAGFQISRLQLFAFTRRFYLRRNTDRLPQIAGKPFIYPHYNRQRDHSQGKGFREAGGATGSFLQFLMWLPPGRAIERPSGNNAGVDLYPPMSFRQVEWME